MQRKMISLSFPLLLFLFPLFSPRFRLSLSSPTRLPRFFRRRRRPFVFCASASHARATDPDGARDGHVLEGLAGGEQSVPLRVREKVEREKPSITTVVFFCCIIPCWHRCLCPQIGTRGRGRPAVCATTTGNGGGRWCGGGGRGGVDLFFSYVGIFVFNLSLMLLSMQRLLRVSTRTRRVLFCIMGTENHFFVVRRKCFLTQPSTGDHRRADHL